MEICLKYRPLTYIEDDPEMSVLTPNAMIIRQSSNLAVEDEGSTELLLHSTLLSPFS